MHDEKLRDDVMSAFATARELYNELIGGRSAVAVDYRVSGPTETLAIRDRVASSEMFDWLDGALRELRRAAADTGMRRVGPDAALYSSELLEDEFGEIVAVIPVESAESSGRAERLDLPRVEYAVAVHHGAVEDIDRTYAALGAVVAERAIGVQGPIREDYLVGAFDTPDESRHRTEIGWPVFHTTARAAFRGHDTIEHPRA
jgi:effector-binding domain-containing protein